MLALRDCYGFTLQSSAIKQVTDSWHLAKTASQKKKKQCYRKSPAHVPQEVWDLELPSILGLAHPQATLDDEDMDDADQKNLSSHDTEALPQPASFLASTTLASSSAPTSTLEVAQVSSSTRIRRRCFKLPRRPQRLLASPLLLTPTQM